MVRVPTQYTDWQPRRAASCVVRVPTQYTDWQPSSDGARTLRPLPHLRTTGGLSQAKQSGRYAPSNGYGIHITYVDGEPANTNAPAKDFFRVVFRATTSKALGQPGMAGGTNKT